MVEINITPSMDAADQIEAIGRQYQLKLWSEIERIGLTSCPYTDSTNAVCLDDKKVNMIRKLLGITERGSPVHAELPTVRKDATPTERLWIFTGSPDHSRNSVMVSMATSIQKEKQDLQIHFPAADEVAHVGSVACYTNGIFAPVKGYNDEQLQVLLDTILYSIDNSIESNRYFLVSVPNLDLVHPLIKMRMGTVFHCSQTNSEKDTWVIQLDAQTGYTRRFMMSINKQEVVDERRRLSTEDKSGDDNLDRSESEQLPVEISTLNKGEENHILDSPSEHSRTKLPRDLGRKRFGRSSSGTSPELVTNENPISDQAGVD